MAEKDSRTEEPTAKRLSEAHRKGQFAKAEEINMVFLMVAFFLILVFVIKDKAIALANFTIYIFENLSPEVITQEQASYWLSQGVLSLMYLLTPFIIASLVSSIIAGGIQSRFRFTPNVLKFDLTKLNPVNGLKRIFSLKSVAQTAVDFSKIVAVILIIWGAVDQIMTDPIFKTPVPRQHIIEFLLKSTLLMFIRVIMAMVVIALIHYLYQRWQTNEDLKMSKEEIKDERKQQEGDPLLKKAQRQQAARIAQRQMLSGVPTADVVVTNPTHFAVALRYERGKDAAPIVVAKGEDVFARRIKDTARKYEVPMVENKTLARVLYKLGRVGEPIPAELYQVVADTLAYVYRTYKYYFYRLKSRRSAVI